MPHIILDDRTIMLFEGPDAEHLLHNVLTCNIETLEPGIAQIGALLTPQGKILFEFFVSKQHTDSYLIDISAHQAEAFVQRMTMYRLRSKVEIRQLDESVVRISWDSDSKDKTAGIRDVRFVGIDVFRSYEQSAAATFRNDWDNLRIMYGIAESEIDYALGDAFPHDVSFDQNGGVDFKKGCYIGQEVVSRMHHRKTARRRILRVHSADELSGGDIVGNGKLIGSVGTVVGNNGLALCRIDRAKDAIDEGHVITADGSLVTLSLPENVNYSWPQSDA